MAGNILLTVVLCRWCVPDWAFSSILGALRARFDVWFAVEPMSHCKHLAVCEVAKSTCELCPGHCEQYLESGFHLLSCTCGAAKLWCWSLWQVFTFVWAPRVHMEALKDDVVCSHVLDPASCVVSSDVCNFRRARVFGFTVRRVTCSRLLSFRVHCIGSACVWCQQE